MLIKTNLRTSHAKHELLRDVKATLISTPYVICPALNRRKVFTDKWLATNTGHSRGSLRRLQTFFAGLDLIRHAETCQRRSEYKNEWELIGETPHDEIVVVHIREESLKNNRLLFYISSYHKSKKTVRVGGSL